MDSIQLEILGRNAVKGTLTHFVGVFPADQLPNSHQLIIYPCSFIVNTDPHYLPGTHWVVFYFSSINNYEFFDSYGHPPSFYPMLHIPTTTSLPLRINTFQIQSTNSKVCGHYCIFFIYFRSRNHSLSYISKTLHDSFNTDNRIRSFIRKLAKILDIKYHTYSRV